MQPATRLPPNSDAPRVLGLLVGDVADQTSSAWVKYGQLFAELGARSHLIDVANVDLSGLDRYFNVVYSLRPSRVLWREAFYKNLWVYKRRSQLARRAIAAQAGKVDLVLQHGATFHAHTQGGPPVVIYTDFTFRLAQREDTWRNPFLTAGGSRAWDRYEYEAYHNAALVLTRSDYTRRSLLDDYAMPAERVITVGGGVNFTELPLPQPIADVPRVLFIGKAFERKGGDLLVAAFERARRQVPAAELWAVTAHAQPDAPGIRWIAPTYDRAVIADLYRHASVFAMPSRAETWGDVFLEAMAYGLPCIGVASDAMPEIIAHGQTGLIVPPDDVDALTEALVTLLTDAALRQAMGRQGRQRVEQRFTWAHVATRITDQLLRVPLSGLDASYANQGVMV